MIPQDSPRGKSFAESHVQKTFAIFYEPGACLELRIPKAGNGNTIGGYFDDQDLFVAAAKSLSGRYPGVYVTLNPINPALLARASNKVKPYMETLTSDGNILKRRWLPIDFDPVRPAGISSTDSEHKKAIERAQQVRNWLGERGWPEPILADSGNGAHLLYRIDLPNDANSRDLIKQSLEALALMYADEQVNVDTSVFNAARIWKLYGTLSAKGDDLPGRPHRLAEFLSVPDSLELVPADKLHALAALAPTKPVHQPSNNTHGKLDAKAWLLDHGLVIRREKPWGSAMVYELDQCPFNPDHQGTARVVQFPSGALSFGCFHQSCQGYDWHALREKLEPDYRGSKQITPDENRFKTLKEAILRLAENCDRAVSADGVGFNKFDQEFGHMLADRIRKDENISTELAVKAYKMLTKYTKQLLKYGIDIGDARKELEEKSVDTCSKSAATGDKKSQADIAIALGKQALLFHDSYNEPFAGIPINGHIEIWPIRSTFFKSLYAKLKQLRAHASLLQKKADNLRNQRQAAAPVEQDPLAREEQKTPTSAGRARRTSSTSRGERAGSLLFQLRQSVGRAAEDQHVPVA